MNVPRVIRVSKRVSVINQKSTISLVRLVRFVKCRKDRAKEKGGGRG